MPRRFRTFQALTVGLAILVMACDQPDVTGLNSGPEPLTAVTPADELARAVAVALREDDVRQGLLQAMRESPLRGRRLHLATYLGTPAGRMLLEAAADGTGSTVSDVSALVEGLPNLELHMPSYLDRVSWTGTPNVRVAALLRGSVSRDGAEPMVRAYAVNGSARAVSVTSPSPSPLIALAAASVEPSAAGTRGPTPALSAPSGNTISPQDWFLEVADLAAPSTPTAGSGPQRVIGGNAGIDIGRTMAQCYMAPGIPIDQDLDYLWDDCELQLASAFAPWLMIHPEEMQRHREEAWGAEVVNMSGGMGQLVRITYLLSYHLDSGHTGDSEIIDLYVGHVPGTTRWELAAGFLSAHWGTPGDRSEGITNPWAFEYFGGPVASAPLIWVAKGKHANYKSVAACFNNIYLFFNDVCGGSVPTRLTVHPQRNIGSDEWFGLGTALLDCTTSMAGQPGTECYWTVYEHESIDYECYYVQGNPLEECAAYSQYPPFYGWQGGGTGSTPYGKILTAMGWKATLLPNPPSNLRTWPPPPPPPPPPLVVYINGPSQIMPGYMWYCGWSAYVVGGTGPYTYQWGWDGLPVGTSECSESFYTTGGLHSISVAVMDATGEIDTDYVMVEVMDDNQGPPGP